VYEHISKECDRLFGNAFAAQSEFVFGSYKRPTRFDIAVVKGMSVELLIEVDGGQHFRLRTGFKCDHEAIRARDLAKEVYAVQNKVPLVRIYQQDVWNDAFDWKATLTCFLGAMSKGELHPKVYRQPHALYHSGEYAALRVGTIVEVGDKE